MTCSHPFFNATVAQGRDVNQPLLLFATAIDIQAIWIRPEEKFEGVLRQRPTLKLSLYADDMLVYVSNSPSSLSLSF